MKIFVTLLTKEKGKTATNEWQNDNCDIIWALYNVYKKIKTVIFPYLLANLFKHLLKKSYKSYKYLNKFISIIKTV